MITQPLPTQESPLRRYGLAALVSLLALLGTILLAPVLGDSIFSPFLAAVMLSAWYGGLGPGLLATGISAIISIYFLISPHFPLAPTLDSGLRIGLFLCIALLISGLSAGRRRAVADAQAARERYAVTLHSIGDAVIATDEAGLIMLMNPVAEDLTGWTMAEAWGRPIDEVFRIVNEGTRQAVESPVQRTLREGRVVGLANHTLLISRDGSERPIDDSGAPVRARDGRVIGAVLVFRDVSARRAEEQAREEVLHREQIAHGAAEEAAQRAAFLARASALLASSLVYEETLQAISRLAVSAIADLCVVFLRSPDGMIRRAAAVHVDPVCEQELRALLEAPIDPAGPHPAAQVIREGRTLIDPSVVESVVAELAEAPERQAALRALNPAAHLVVPLIARDTTIGAISLGRVQPGAQYTAEDLLFAQEIAQRAALAVDNARLYAEAQAAIQVRDRFLALAAHELRTPLTGAMGNVQILRRRLAEQGGVDERIRRNVQRADDQLRQLNQLISTLLDSSRLEGGQLQLSLTQVDICALARRVVSQIEDTLVQHTVTCEAPESALIVTGDPLRLEQVLANLLQNAVKYSPAGGAIGVRVGQADERVFVAVRDSGIGISAAALPRLFERFYRAPEVEQGGMSGIGVGLYVVREIIGLHGGAVQVESEAGHGSTFTIWLPQATGRWESVGEGISLPEETAS